MVTLWREPEATTKEQREATGMPRPRVDRRKCPGYPVCETLSRSISAISADNFKHLVCQLCFDFLYVKSRNAFFRVLTPLRLQVRKLRKLRKKRVTFSR